MTPRDPYAYPPIRPPIQPGLWLLGLLGLVVLLHLLPPAIECVERFQELFDVLRGRMP